MTFTTEKVRVSFLMLGLDTHTHAHARTQKEKCFPFLTLGIARLGLEPISVRLQIVQNMRSVEHINITLIQGITRCYKRLEHGPPTRDPRGCIMRPAAIFVNYTYIL